uniref:SdrD B-like domain-containing protein n=1 Tax=Persicitalea sp. TaxID=3100273 RepID=UPI0035939E50
TVTLTVTASNLLGCSDTTQLTVNVNPLPNAGSDTTLVCIGNSVPKSLELSASPLGGVYTQFGPNVALINGNTVSELLPGNTYNFVYTINGCSDTIVVTIGQCVLGSIGDYVFKDKNNDGLQDGGDAPVQGVKLNLYAAANGTKTGPILASDTTDAAGKYLFDSLSAGNYIVEIDQTTLPDTCQISAKKDVNANANDMTDSDFDPTSGLSQVVTLNPTVLDDNSTLADSLATNNLTVDAALVNKSTDKIDLALDKSVDKKLAMLGDTVAYTIRVYNEGQVLATGVQVSDTLAASLQFVSSNGAYSPVTKVWMVGSVAPGDTVSIVIKARVIAAGVTFNTAQISKVNEQDVDSTPGDNAEGEDDLDRECLTVPILVCRGQGQGVQLTVPAQYTGVVWFRKAAGGQPEQVATDNIYVASETELGTYEYSFTSASGSCPADGCCPTIIVVEDCCPAQVCVPFTVTKKKK